VVIHSTSLVVRIPLEPERNPEAASSADEDVVVERVEASAREQTSAAGAPLRDFVRHAR
jgi:hypothetical protein